MALAWHTSDVDDDDVDDDDVDDKRSSYKMTHILIEDTYRLSANTHLC